MVCEDGDRNEDEGRSISTTQETLMFMKQKEVVKIYFVMELREEDDRKMIPRFRKENDTKRYTMIQRTKTSSYAWCCYRQHIKYFL